MAAAVKPKCPTAWGTLRNKSTKPSEQVAAPPGMCGLTRTHLYKSDYHMPFSFLHEASARGPSRDFPTKRIDSENTIAFRQIWNLAVKMETLEASVPMQRLSYPTETVLSNKITRYRIVLSFKGSLRKPLGRRH